MNQTGAIPVLTKLMFYLGEQRALAFQGEAGHPRHLPDQVPDGTLGSGLDSADVGARRKDED